MDLIVDPGQVGDGRALTYSAELVINRTVAKADPALVGAKIGNRNAAEMRANGRAADNRGVAGVRNGSL